MQVFFSTRDKARQAKRNGLSNIIDNGVNATKGKRYTLDVKHNEQFPFVSGMLARNTLGGFVPVEWKNRKRHIITM